MFQKLSETKPEKLKNFLKQLSIQFSIDTITILIFIWNVFFRWFLSEVPFSNPRHVTQITSVRRALFLIRKRLPLAEKFSISSKNIHSRIIRTISFFHLLEEFFGIEFIIFIVFSHINLFSFRKPIGSLWRSRPIRRLENGPEQAWTGKENDVWGSFHHQSLLEQSFEVSKTLGHGNISAYCRNHNTKNLI